MRTIAIINQKGGCGKTTVSINLASVMAARGKRTLLVDMDPQSHCSLGLAVPESQIDRSISDMLRSGFDGSLAFRDIVWQISRNLDLAPSTMSLAGIEQELAGTSDKDRRLMQVLSAVQDQYDFCIVDCPPAISLLTFNALRASTEVIIPVETGYFALQGAIRQEATIQMLARRVNHRVRFNVLATMYDVRTKLAREILGELRRNFGERLLPVVINFNSKLKEAASFGQPITEYDPASRGNQDFDKLAAWLIANPPLFETTDPTTGAAASTNPASNRAAELVERARHLQQRTAALAAKLANDPDMVIERVPIAPVPSEPESVASIPEIPQPVPTPTLTEKLTKLYGVRPTSQGLLFVQPAGNGTGQVAIAGDFNGWSATTHPLKLDQNLNVWQACVQVPSGRYRYRLVVDGRWTADPYNTYVEANPFGELNNVVEIGINE